MRRIEIRRQRFVRNPWRITRYEFIDHVTRRTGRGLRLTAGRWIAYIDYRVRPLPASWWWDEL